ncbi:MAG TPA: response regulator [Polyangiales bacterium]
MPTSRTRSGTPPLPSREAASVRVMLAEDDTEMRNLLVAVLKRDGHELVEARSGSHLLDLLGTQLLHARDRPAADLIITDIRMPGASGLDVVAGLRHAGWATPVIFITAFGDAATHAQALRLGAKVVFDKPFDLDDLRMAVQWVAMDGAGQRPA